MKPFIVGICLSVPTIYIVRKLFEFVTGKIIYNERKRLGGDYRRINQTITFGLDIPGHFCECSSYKVCCNKSKLNYLLNLIRNAKDSLDVCIYMLTADVVADSIIETKKKGVLVRVITDHDMSRSTNAIMQKFYNNGITVKYKVSNFIMHHKFIVIDKELLIFGSMNFTMPAIHTNWETIIVTSSRKLVPSFSNLYETLWKQM